MTFSGQPANWNEGTPLSGNLLNRNASGTVNLKGLNSYGADGETTTMASVPTATATTADPAPASTSTTPCTCKDSDGKMWKAGAVILVIAGVLWLFNSKPSA